MTDRRRINPPNGGTAPPVFLSSLSPTDAVQFQRPKRSRQPNELRQIFLKTGLNPSASGSAYFELSPPTSSPSSTATTTTTTTTSLPPFFSSSSTPKGTLKLTCSIHGPHPLPRSQPYTPHLHLSTSVKFAPFASPRRRATPGREGPAERDLAAQLETALRGVAIGERWPKSGVDVCVTVLEEEGGEGEERGGGEKGGMGGWGAMVVLAGCVTVASAAMVDAGIDCVDLVSGGVVAVVADGDGKGKGLVKSGEGGKEQNGVRMVLDPSPNEHERVVAAAMVAYLQSRDEITQLWVKGDAGVDAEDLINGAVHAAIGARTVMAQELREAGARKFGEAEEANADKARKTNPGTANDVLMSG
ncbi:MAG: 3'-5'-exoribonuclease [Bathelium mastoideum]|nr:MAG: 3'-5'-exoribonuclease [Bathelium mastoideum]